VTPRSTALVFMDTECPISNRLVSRLGELSELARALNVDFYGVLSDPGLTRAKALAHSSEYKVTFPILFDAAGLLSRQLRPTHVPESFVLDRDGKLAYRGRVDDRFADVGKLRPKVRSHELRDAIRSTAVDQPPKVEFAEPVGCIFEAWDGSQDSMEITYSREVAPILNAHCVQCHRPGEVAPFPLENYQDARRRSKMIAAVVEDRFMPPWKATEGHGRFRDERRLSAAEIAILRSWANAGAPGGDPADLPERPSFGNHGWALGEPDLILTMPDFEVPAEGDDLFHYFVIPSGLTEDRMIIAHDFRAGDATVAHHSIYYTDTTGKARELDAQTPEPGYPAYTSLSQGFFPSSAFGGWAPGGRPYELPEGVGIPIEAGTDVILEMHYHLSGKATTDASQVAVYFADGPVEQVADGIILGTLDLDIPPGATDYWRHVWMELPVGITLLDIGPHMHLLGKEAKVEARLPDGTIKPLLWVQDYDFRWQDTYVYAEPLYLPAGTRIDARVRYDNSVDNPANPYDPPRSVGYGDATTDEMCFVFSTVLPDDPKQSLKLQYAQWECFSREGDGDGWYDWSEWGNAEDWFGSGAEGGR
jgi:hypothetical protein